MSITFTLQNIKNIINKSVTTPELVNKKENIFLFKEIVEEVIFIDKLIQWYNSENKKVSMIESKLREALNKSETLKGEEKKLNNVKIYDLKGELSKQINWEKQNGKWIVRKVFNPNAFIFDTRRKVFIQNNCFFKFDPSSPIFSQNGLDYKCSLFSQDGNYDPNRCIYNVHYYGIFNLNVPIRKRTISLEKLDDSWGLGFWKQFYNMNIGPEDFNNIDIINSFLIIYTEMTRIIIQSLKNAEIKESLIKGITPKEIELLKEKFWAKCDLLKEKIFKYRNQFDTFMDNDEVFQIITELYNGSIDFYDGNQIGYPCKYFRHLEIFSNWKDGVEWCFKNISEFNAPFIRGYLKNFTRLNTFKVIEIHDSDSPAELLIPYSKTTPFILLREFLRAVHDGNIGNDDYMKKNRLRILEQLAELFQERFVNFEREQESRFDDDYTINEFSYIGAENHLNTILGLAIILMIQENTKLLLIKSQKEVDRLDKILEFALNAFKQFGCESLKYVCKKASAIENYKNELRDLLVYFGISSDDWFEYKDYENLFKSFGAYLPKVIHLKYMECEDYEYEFEKNLKMRSLIGFNA